MLTSSGRANAALAARSAWVGSALEYYDFFLYGTAAALVFGRVFFPEGDRAVGTLVSLATFGVGYAARPLGAIVLGHVGDRHGRRRVLLLTVVAMGITTFLIGCLPSYAVIGIAAPILLVLLRLLQGFFAGGEQASANSATLEHAPDGQRAYFSSFTLMGTQGGQAIATMVFIPVAALPEHSLLTWGWRVPFWISAVVAVVAVLIRRSLQETPVFVRGAERDDVARVPLAELFRHHWRAVARVVFAALIATPSTIFTVWALSYAVNTLGLDRTPMLWVGVLANLVAMAAIPLWGRLSDRTGRKRQFIAGSIGSAVMTFAYLWSISTRSYVLIGIVGVLFFGVVYTMTSAVWPAFYGEMFPARVRLTGTALGTQIGFAIAGFVPSIIGWVVGSTRDAWLGAAVITALLCLVSIVAVSTARETFRVPTARLGGSSEPRDDAANVAA
ncbi:MFS transporter [Actinoplanes cyaneus]|uniref:MFS transporter n=1 Tax=Actinoplanes cyaneus TaxID=52696 RepID=A0A919IJH3_9ACTN|nr:MFS transporter [Actinoplanes cyaneus]MCW2141124.1 Na+/melibiose symporter [Actinoplanes cyaneus]GID67185.1 MFS transporter [Actinoplanes cyaneus]